MDHLIQRLEALGTPRVALVGDFMIDRYVYGDVERINPEAPVPVLRTLRSESRAGGAGNVARAILAMGGKALCCGVIGKDELGRELADMLAGCGADTRGLLAADDRPTAVKTRYIGLAQHRHAQQMLRVDEEQAKPLTGEAQEALLSAVQAQLPRAEIVALEDYGKGVLDGGLGCRIIEQARRAGLAVVVDPALTSDYSRYRGATLLTPNRYEAALASGVQITDEASMALAGERIAEAAEAEAVLITLDKEGGYLYQRGGRGTRIPHHRPREVYDVSGAGDEVLAVMAGALAGGWSCQDAAALANVAGGLEVERYGIIPVTRQEMLEELHRMVGLRGGKVLDRQRLSAELARRKAHGQTVVFTNGCFDLLHMGHVRFLRQARQQGHCLVVAINSDQSVRRLKGAGRPVIPQGERAEMLAALECVDYVTIFDEETSAELLKLLGPQVFAKGGSTGVVVERDVAESCGIRVVTLDLVQGLSTTGIIERVLDSRGSQ